MKIKIKNNFIYGKSKKSAKSDSLVIMISGLSGSMNYHLFLETEKYFYKNKFDTLRFNFCNDELQNKKKAFNLENLNFLLYISILNNIFNEIIKNHRYKKIILIGHSFGAFLSVIFLNKHKKYLKNTELILWEPSVLPWKRKYMEEDFIFEKTTKLYLDKNTKEKINRVFYEECIETKNSIKEFGLLKKDSLIVAVKGSADVDAKKYYLENKNSWLIILEKTNHDFKGKKAKKELFSNTLKFINRK